MRQDLIALKLAHLDEQVDVLTRSEKIVTRIGGKTIHSRADDIAFHQRRRDMLAWAASQNDTAVAAKRAALVASLPTGAELLIRGDVRGLDAATVETIAMIELLDIATGSAPNLPKAI